MNNKPEISLVGSAIRTDLWMRLHESVAYSDVPFEIVLVGHVSPGFTLPANIRHIYSTVKPAQCLEIGIRLAKGRLIMVVEDGNIFRDGTLDRMYECYMNKKDSKSIISASCMVGGDDISRTIGRLLPGNIESPIMPYCGLLARDMWVSAGGIDRHFIALYGDCDMMMRMYQLGARCEFCEGAIIEEAHNGPTIIHKNRLLLEYGQPYDKPLFDSLWIAEGKVRVERAVPVDPFDDSCILTSTQGEKGRW